MDQKEKLDGLRADGWQVRKCTLTGKQVYLWGVLFALPFLFLAGGMYRTFLLHRAVLLDHTGILLLFAAAVSLPIHEGLHSLGWKLSGRLKKEDTVFLLCHGLPMCPCKAILSAKAYLIGVFLPFLVLGGGSLLFLILYPGTISLLTALVNLTLPGADLVIAYEILRSGAALVADSPECPGFIGLYHKD